MNKYNIKDFFKGWFIGNFSPSLFKTENFEVAVKYYNKGDGESGHYHKIATEWTMVIKGSVQMGDSIYTEGDIIEIPPYKNTDFEALEETATVVIKIPSVKDDKYTN